MTKYLLTFVLGSIIGVGSFEYITRPKIEKPVAYSLSKKDPIGAKINDLKIRFKQKKK